MAEVKGGNEREREREPERERQLNDVRSDKGTVSRFVGVFPSFSRIFFGDVPYVVVSTYEAS